MAPWTFLLRGATFAISLLVAVASPLGSGDVDSSVDLLLNLTQPNGEYGLQTRAAKDFYLRVMPLGASITNGGGSSTGNGYRKPLRDQLRYVGWKVNMVGSLQSGTMKDKDNEGHSGWVISAVHDIALTTVSQYKPNLILINVGLNDCGQNIDINGGGSRMKSLVDSLFQMVPSTTVVLSTLVPHGDPTTNACLLNLNSQYRNLANSYQGRRFAIADMYDFVGLDGVWPVGSASNGHPTDTGFLRMAAVWWNAIQRLEAGIQAPDGSYSDAVGDTTCAKTYGKGRGPVQTQGGSGHDGGNYHHDSTCIDSVWSDLDRVGDDHLPEEIYFGQLVNTGGADRAGATEEMIRAQILDGFVWSYHYALNNAGTFGAWTEFHPGDCKGGGTVWFADLNNDGLDDFFCIDTYASVSVSLNLGGNPPKWDGLHKIIDSPGGSYSYQHVRIADIDGDGRTDYCLVHPKDATIRCWRNGGVGQYVDFWQSFNAPGGGGDIIFRGDATKYGDFNGVRLGDLNGDFRADWMFVDDTGGIHTQINRPGWGLGIAPYWQDAGQTHGGPNIKGSRAVTRLGRVYGSNRLDYLYFTSSDRKWSMKACRETGGGGIYHKSMGTNYCDMTGSGVDDYVWMYSDGTGEIYPNIQHKTPTWQWGQWLSLEKLGFAPRRERASIHLADIDGDGRCDVLSQRKSDGALEMWRNDYNPATKKWAFTYLGFNTPPRCAHRWGVGWNDRSVHLADLDGDGRADYLCIGLDGNITGWLNLASGWVNVSESKSLRVGIVPTYVLLMSMLTLPGDGKAEIIWLNKWNGEANVWINKGKIQSGASAFTWANPNAKTILWPSIGERGANIKFGVLGGQGSRADLVQDFPLSNKAFTYFNECPDAGNGDGGDDGPITNPNLPNYDPGNTCTSGSGSGNYGALCTFCCRYGFCPSPCTCTSTGLVNAPSPIDGTDGFATAGKDAASLDPLCSFACSRGTCPYDVCDEVIEDDTPELPIVDNLDPLDPADFGNYVEGDSFYYENPTTGQFSINLYVSGPPATWEDIDCGPESAPGQYGETLGCEAMAVAYLFYGIILTDIADQKRDVVTRSEAHHGRHFQLHEHWAPDGDTTTRHKLLKRAPLDTWVSLGNGTYNGIPHEIRFIHHEDYIGHQVIQNPSLQNSSHPDRLETRGRETFVSYFPGRASFYQANPRLDTNYYPRYMGYNPSDAAEFIGESVEKASAESGRKSFCPDFIGGDDTISDPGYLEWQVSSLGTNSAAIYVALANCRKAIDSIIYPRDGNDIDEIKALLATFTLAKVVEHRSLSGWGMLYWTASLTHQEVAKVKSKKQVQEVDVKCSDGCPNPQEFPDDSVTARSLDFNGTTPLEMEKRQIGLVSRDARPELAFVSTPPGATLGDQYRYDESSGEGVSLYLIQSKAFDLTMSDFQAKDSVGQTLEQKATPITLVGPPAGWNIKSGIHSNCMLNMAAGARQGIANRVWPKLFLYDPADGPEWVLDILDRILVDFAVVPPLSDNIAHLAVLNMPFTFWRPEFAGATAYGEKFSGLLNRLVTAGVLPVVSAGNDNEIIKGFPAVFGNEAHRYHVPGLLTVSGVNNDGTKWPQSNFATWVRIAAPVDALCRFRDGAAGVERTNLKSGTSGSCAKVAGLAAYFIGFSSLKARFRSVFDVADYIVSLGYARGGPPNIGRPLSIWNSVT